MEITLSLTSEFKKALIIKLLIQVQWGLNNLSAFRRNKSAHIRRDAHVFETRNKEKGYFGRIKFAQIFEVLIIRIFTANFNKA